MEVFPQNYGNGNPECAAFCTAHGGGCCDGKGLQGSLYWGLSVINGGKDDETEATDSLVENTELSTISESEGTENRDGGSTVSASQVEALKKRLKRNWQNKRRSSRSH